MDPTPLLAKTFICISLVHPTSLCINNMLRFWHNSLINYVGRELASRLSGIPASSLLALLGNYPPTISRLRFPLASPAHSPRLCSSLPTSPFCQEQNMRARRMNSTSFSNIWLKRDFLGLGFQVLLASLTNF